MKIKSILNTLVQRNRDAAILSAYKTRALTNYYEACHGDFAYLPELGTMRADGSAEEYSQNNRSWNVALAR
ncbi:MAG: hypothetical protein LIO94_08465 [Clostridiales bacterium]|nr:hypothetical protein [Clostridiales bacterium]